MVKRLLTLLALCVLTPLYALAEGREVEIITTTAAQPASAPTYTLEYQYPFVSGQDEAAVLINDLYDMARDEMTELILPMFANEKMMVGSDVRRMTQECVITCNNGRFLSFLFRRAQDTDEGTKLSLEANTFDIGGEYAGQTLTLRGVVMVGESTDQIVEALTPKLYEQFLLLQQSGVLRADLTQEDFSASVFPYADFYTDEEGNAVFFFQPDLMTVPSFDVPVFVYSAEMLKEFLSVSNQ